MVQPFVFVYFSAKYHTHLHKPLAGPVFMRSLAMYDEVNIIHESYINDGNHTFLRTK